MKLAVCLVIFAILPYKASALNEQEQMRASCKAISHKLSSITFQECMSFGFKLSGATSVN